MQLVQCLVDEEFWSQDSNPPLPESGEWDLTLIWVCIFPIPMMTNTFHRLSKSPDLSQYVLFLELGAVLIFGSYLHNKEKKSLEPDLGSNPPSATSTLRRPLP